MGCATSTDTAETGTPSAADTTATASASNLHSAPSGARASKATAQTSPPRHSPAGSPLRRRPENPLESDPLLSPALYSFVPRQTPGPPPVRHGPSQPPQPSNAASRRTPPATPTRTTTPTAPTPLRRHGPQPRSPARGASSSPLASGHGSAVLHTPEPSGALGMNRPPRAPPGAGGKRPSGAGSFGSRADALTPQQHKRHSGSLTHCTLFGPASQLSTTYGSLNSSSRSGRYTSSSEASASVGPSDRPNITLQVTDEVAVSVPSGGLTFQGV